MEQVEIQSRNGNDSDTVAAQNSFEKIHDYHAAQHVAEKTAGKRNGDSDVAYDLHGEHDGAWLAH